MDAKAHLMTFSLLTFLDEHMIHRLFQPPLLIKTYSGENMLL